MIGRSAVISGFSLTHSMSKKRPKGFNQQRFIEEVPSEYLCGLCKRVAKQPNECSECGHLFCQGCFKYSMRHCSFYRLSQNFFCPICEHTGPLKKTSRILVKIIGSLLLRCKHTGCSQIVELGKVAFHQKECVFREVTCCSRNCGGKGVKRDFVGVVCTHQFIRYMTYQQVRFACSDRCATLTKFEEAVLKKDKAALLGLYFKILK